MKKDIHPKLKPTVFIDISTKEEYKTLSTLESEETKTIDGKEYQVVEVQISSSSHPFYTGKHRIVDTENLVEKFEKKRKKASTMYDKLQKSKSKKKVRKSKTSKVEESKPLTLKDMLKNM